MKTWKKYLLYAAYLLIASGLLYGLLQLILAGYSAPWTGFGERTLSNGDIVGEKTLWDWLELLIIPLVLALGAFFLNRSERALERKIADERIKEDRKIAEDRAKLERDLATDRQQEAALQTYLDRMSELLLKEKLRTTEVIEVRDVARTRTLSIMRVLDTKRNNQILQFLREAKLITDERSIFNGANMREMNLQELNLEGVALRKVDLKDAHLEHANLQNTHLDGANLQGANMQHANLWQAYLPGANLEDGNLQDAFVVRANLSGAHLERAKLQRVNIQDANLQDAYFIKANLSDALLRDADLQGAILPFAHLKGADLRHANLQRAFLDDANLQDANVTPEQLAQAKSIKGATMPDGTIHE